MRRGNGKGVRRGGYWKGARWLGAGEHPRTRRPQARGRGAGCTVAVCGVGVAV